MDFILFICLQYKKHIKQKLIEKKSRRLKPFNLCALLTDSITLTNLNNNVFMCEFLHLK